MYKSKLTKLVHRLLRPSPHGKPLIKFTKPRQAQNQDNSYSQNQHPNTLWIYASCGVAIAGAYQLYQQKDFCHAEEKKEEQEQQPNFLKKMADQFEIPKLLIERDKQKQKEYDEREEIDIEELEDLSREDAKSMQDLDRVLGREKFFKQEDQEEEAEDAETLRYNPFAPKKKLTMKHQEFRIIEVGPENILKNGQMIQVSVCDPFDENMYHPTDKVIIYKLNDKYYATGSFCGFDFTNLGTGVFLGNKVICPTCGSSYNVENGFVDQGPSMRNISSFHIMQRDEKIKIVIPEHVPAFAKKNLMKKIVLDPRTFVILGDSEAALSAIDAMRTSFSGRIVVVPVSPFGAFENTDIFNRKFSQLSKNEVYMVEEDYLERANVDVIKGEVKSIDLTKKQISIKGHSDMIDFDKVLIAWGAYKQRLNKEYSNVYYLEDRHVHAKVHNEILKAKQVMIMGGTFEAYNTAASVREYLDSLGYNETQVVLFDNKSSEVQQCFGQHISNQISEMLREKRISVILNASILRIEGLNKIETLYFQRDKKEGQDKNVEYYLKPDVVIAENGVGQPKFDLQKLLQKSEDDEGPLQLGIDPNGVPASDIKFSLHYNDLHSPIFAAGSCTQYPSFMHKIRLRTQDIKYNIEAAFYAAMNMMDKRVEFRYIPFTAFRIGETPVNFVGERTQAFHEVIINGSLEDRKFVAYFVYGGEVVGFMTCGFKNVHLYLWEAMKLLIMPPAALLRSKQIDYKDLVKSVLKMRPQIRCKKHEIVNIPSTTLAEHEHELERSAEFQRKLKDNIDRENQLQKEKFKQLKEKYDREGVEFVEDESQMLDEEQQSNLQKSKRGVIKPGGGGRLQQDRNNLNMGQVNEDQKNPFMMLFNQSKKAFDFDIKKD